MADITLPALGESVTEGTITRWLKQVGDTVEVDEPLVEISTDKVDTEVPSPIAGTITEILADEDDTVDVGAVIARVGDAGDAPRDAAPAETPAEESVEEPAAPAADDVDADVPDEAPERPSTDESEPAPAPTAGASDAGGDATDITLPALGESVTEGTITRWLKKVGDSIEVDEPLVEISTDKVDTEVPSPVAGTISELLAEEDDTVDVGAVIARVGGSAGGSAPAEAPAQDAPAEEAPAQEAPAEEPKVEAKPAEAPAAVQGIPPAPKAPEAPAAPKQEAPKQEAPKQEAPAQDAPKQQAPAAPATSSGSVYVTPIVRKLAHERGVDLTTVQGTGVGGRIRKEDVLSAAEAAASSAPAAAAAPAASAPATVEDSPLRGTTAKMSRLRKVVAKRAVESMQTTAQLTTVVEVDVTKVAQLRDRVKGRFQEETGQKLSFLPFFSLAAVEALRAHPVINATDDGEEITYPDVENLSMAVDTERGLLTPVIKDAGRLDLRGFAEQIADLASRTRDNKLGPDELAGGTFTLTNTGSRGALFDTPVVFQPQRAILGVGTVVKRPVVVSVDGQDSIAVRSMVFLALSYDHRIIDGADAARYLTQVKQRLEAGDFEGQLGI
ncbi:hypothetical protein GCM10009846_15860 [Agrococcus versicolor]|uniref:Dihydrolipoamide acetyltransferase component of pyruvate dehydrogenase complex n=1 Tax=Agrococcus versicolor TaxID=501482 RepID=A0ABN3ARC2_9MICO